MLITKELDVKLVNGNIKYYENLGYNIPKVLRRGKFKSKVGEIIKVKIKDIPLGSSYKIHAKCDFCGCDIFTEYSLYMKNFKTDYMKCLSLI